MSIDELIIKQAKLATLNQILEAYRLNKKTELHIEPVSFSGISGIDSIAESHRAIMQHDSLNSLESEGLIEIRDYQSLLGIHLVLIDLPALKKAQKQLSDSIPAHGNLPRIVYSVKTGRGKINGEPFRLNKKSDNRLLFRKLVTAPEYRLSRSEAWKAINRRDSVKSAIGIQDFSKNVSKLRAGLKNISKKHLRYKDKILQLNADIHITD